MRRAADADQVQALVPEPAHAGARPVGQPRVDERLGGCGRRGQQAREAHAIGTEDDDAGAVVLKIEADAAHPALLLTERGAGYRLDCDVETLF